MQANLQILPNFSLGQATRRGTFFTERLLSSLVPMDKSQDAFRGPKALHGP